MTRSIRTTVAAAALTATGATLLSAAPAFGAFTGSGATFPALAYRDWCQNSGLCSYTPKGSTGGINDFIAGTVDVAGSDAVMTETQLTNLRNRRGGVGAYYFPTLLGAITVPTRVDGVTKRLRLSGKTVGLIFGGQITRWNDRRIAATNRGVRLPNADITVCVRSDGSGTTFGFTNYLAKVSPEFRSSTGGASQLPDWKAPRVVRGPGNPGVAQCVRDNSNSIGYVDLGDATNAGLSGNIASIGKFERFTRTVKRGNRRVKRTTTREVFTLPSLATIAKAGNLKSFALDNPFKLQFDLVNSSSPGAYPITITTFILAYTDYQAAGRSGSLADVRAFLNYAYGTGQGRLAPFGFVNLPPAMIRASRQQLAKLK